MKEEYELLIEKEEILAKMYIQLLEQNKIKCMVVPVNGVGLSMKMGCQDFLRIYVPVSEKGRAEGLINELSKKD